MPHAGTEYAQLTYRRYDLQMIAAQIDISAGENEHDKKAKAVHSYLLLSYKERKLSSDFRL